MSTCGYPTVKELIELLNLSCTILFQNPYELKRSMILSVVLANNLLTLPNTVTLYFKDLHSQFTHVFVGYIVVYLSLR